MNPFTILTSRAVSLPLNDIDTDQIIPARYLKITDKSNLGKALFSDWRYHPDGSEIPGFILNQPSARSAAILFAGRNFGCGSSREHAPWALVGFGFRAVIALSFADIFRNNALKNGLLPVRLDDEFHQRLANLLLSNPEAEISIDLKAQTVALLDGSQGSFPIDTFSKTCLLKGVDELGYLLSFREQIKAYEAQF